MQDFLKDPDATLDYVFDWTDWLADGETIASHDIDTPTGITNEQDSELNGLITVWLSGGTAGSEYVVGCEITTSVGRVDERSIRLKVEDR